MRKQSLWIFGSICTILVFAFNNCSNGFQTTDVASGVEGAVDSAYSMAEGSRRSLTNDGSSSDSTANVPGSGSGVPAAQSGSAAPVFPYRLYTAKSLLGPWVENGVACRGEATYFRVVGFSMDKKVKGCLSLSSKSDCLDLNKHREFTSNERINGDIVTVITASDSFNWPLDKYTSFISELQDDRTVILRTVGTTQIKNCGTSNSNSGQKSCSWTQALRIPVAGPCSSPTSTCTQGSVGTRTSISCASPESLEMICSCN